MTIETSFLPGTEVQARGLRWEVVFIEDLGPQKLFRLRGVENAVLGSEIDLLSPFEQIEPIHHDFQPERAAPLPSWLVYHQAFLLEQSLGADAMVSLRPGRVRLEPYQLVPVLRAIKMSRVRLLLADGVGLGKTIQAGMLIIELFARRLAHRVLIVSPAGPLLDQWNAEMRERFGLRFDIIDRTRLEEIRRGTELGANLFDHIPLGLASVDFLKQEHTIDQLDRTSWDIIIIDEAHHCMDVGGAQDRDDSQRRKLAEVLARRCDTLLLLTATPHDGNDRSFASLCELLDPSLVDGRGVLRGERFREHVIRRLKRHVTIPDPDHPGERKPLFPERIVTPLPVQPQPAEHDGFLQFQSKLLDLIAPELRRALRNRSYSDLLAWLSLLKRSVSTIDACANTLAVVADRFQSFLADTADTQEQRRQRVRTLRDYERKIARFGVISADEEKERSVLEAEDIAQQLASMQRELRRGSYQQARITDVVTHLDELVSLAMEIRNADPKLDKLISELRAIRLAEPGANILIYTEYVDSQLAAQRAIEQSAIGTVITINGDDNEKNRREKTTLFRSSENIILVSTDASSEGLNLQQRCHHLIHLELPFNPNRLEQRNGRIDRYGQTVEPHIRYMYLCGTFEERILLRLIAKYERMRARLTFVPNTLGVNASTDAAQARLLEGLIEEQTNLFAGQPVLFNFSDGNENEGADNATRELLEEIDRAIHGFREAAETNTWLEDTGANAEEGMLSEVEQARSKGKTSADVDLAQFVHSAVVLGGGRISGSIQEPWFTISLPPSWTAGLDEQQGYEPQDRTIRLTTSIDISEDEQKRAVGFLGRAHPLVRTALDRVRNLSYGTPENRGQDQRVSAVKGQVDNPAVLFTFLGRVTGRAGRMYEQVVAVLVGSDGTREFFPTSESWLHLAEMSNAIRTTGIWENYYSSWVPGVIATSNDIALSGFKPIGDEYIKQQTSLLQKERETLDEWLHKRSEEITGAEIVTAVQVDVFDSAAPVPQTDWQTIVNPADRLAAFHKDKSRPNAKRSEADGVLRLYEKRSRHLDSLLAMHEPEVVALGLLFIIPEAGYAA
jgi:superfamily II DNA or RNA helicase